MARRKAALNTASDLVYGVGKMLRWARAFQRGPEAVAKRAGRVWFGRRASRVRDTIFKP